MIFLVTTSRDPSRRTRTFISLLSKSIPLSHRFNRGTSSIKNLQTMARGNHFQFIIITSTKCGNPSYIDFWEYVKGEKCWIQPIKSWIIHNVKLHHDLGVSVPPQSSSISLLSSPNKGKNAVERVFFPILARTQLPKSFIRLEEEGMNVYAFSVSEKLDANPFLSFKFSRKE